MTWTDEIERRAARELRQLDRPVQGRILSFLRRRLPIWIAGLAIAQWAGAAAAEKSTTKPGSRPFTALVLSGGGARGGAHLGVLQVLERERVPIDLIVGTSMGAVVGSLYASGRSTEYIEAKVREIDWQDLLVDRPPRRTLPFRRKEDDRVGFAQFELGLGKGGIKLPSGFQSGQKVWLVLQSMLLHTFGIQHFDDLPIPFRAVASSLDSGQQVVFEDGELATAVRASMSIPLLFAPVKMNGETLVDGGLLNNLPIDLALELGAERIIAVDISSPLGEIGDEQSLFGVGGRSIKVLVRENVLEARALLRPGDLYLRPELGDLGTLDFERVGESIPLGRAAAEEALTALRAFSVAEEPFARYLEQQRLDESRAFDFRIDQVVVSGNERVSPRLITSRMRTEPGQQLDLDTLYDDLQRIYELGAFEEVRFHLATDSSRNELEIDVKEKSWGPGFIRIGLALESNLSGEGTFRTLTQYTQTQINSRGAEWRTGITVGDRDSVGTEFYQPLDYRGFFFVAPQASWIQTRANLFLEDGGVFRLDLENSAAGLDLGVQFRNYGELRLGVERSSLKVKELSGSLGFVGLEEDGRLDTYGYRGRLIFDLLDDPFFPRTGWLGVADLFLARDSLGGDRDYDQFAASALKALSFGRNTYLGELEYGSGLGSDLPLEAEFSLGGFLRLSGVDPGVITGDRLLYGSLIYYRQIARLPSALGTGMYLGGALEAGNVWDVEEDSDLTDLRTSAALVFGLDSIIGPIYLGYGLADEGEKSFYLFLGNPF